MHHVGALGHGDDLVDELRGIGDADGVADVELLGRGVGVLVVGWESGVARGRTVIASWAGGRVRGGGVVLGLSRFCGLST